MNLTKITNDPALQIAIWPNSVDDGLGDFAIAATAANTVFQKLKLQAHQVVLVSNAPEKFQLFNHQKFAIIDCETAQKSKSIALVILAPLTQGYNQPYFTPQPTLSIAECNSFRELHPSLTWAKSVSFGIGDKTIGLPFDSSFEVYLQNRDESFKTLPPGLKSAIALDQRKLCIGYARSEEMRRAYAGAMAVNAIKSQCPITIVLPGASLELFESCRHIENIHYCSEYELCEPIPRDNSSALIRIITGKIPYHQLLALHAHAEPETLCTGDSSVILSLQRKAKMVVEYLPHKTSFVKNLSRFLGIQVELLSPQYFNVDSLSLMHRFLEIWDSYPPSYEPAQLDAWPNIEKGLEALDLSAPFPRILENADQISFDQLPVDQPVFIPLSVFQQSKIGQELPLYPNSDLSVEKVARDFVRVVRKKPPS